MKAWKQILTAVCAMAALAALTRTGHGQQPRLSAGAPTGNGWLPIQLHQPTNRVYTLQSSEDLRNWRTFAVLHGREEATNPPALPYLDRPQGGLRFYRALSQPLTLNADWRNQVFFPDDPFRSESMSFGIPEVRWIKFAITTNEPNRVYFQNSWKYKFHYDFAKARLPDFQGMSPEQFDAVSLRTNGQRIVLGTVLFAPKEETREAGIQFVGHDAFRAEQIAEWMEVARAAILPNFPPGGLKVMYMPTYEQSALTAEQRAYLAARGIEVSSAAAWDTGENSYASGWAIGKLKFFPAAQIAAAYESGALRPEDILLTDAVPAEIPYVSGIVTLTPATPNSHVAILARSYGVPFVHLAEVREQERAMSWLGREVVVTAFPGYPFSEIQLIDASQADPALRAEIAELKKAEPIRIAPKARYGAYSAATDGLKPADIQFVGGKAANFGFLRRQIPTNSPEAMAISFDLWDDFMLQVMPGGKTLREEIAARLNPHRYPANVGSLAQDLQIIRDLIEDATVFTAEQQEAIAAALLGRFDPARKIRFRSSTNVEDGETFTGAGLYDSYSGCLADDRDGDSAGPSLCDAAESKERGVFRAIRKVYASFYNLNAALERLRHGVREADAGMAILVHYSSPDEFELANGVATLAFQKEGGTHSFQGKMVTQKGAVSVTNPDGTARPEVAVVSHYFGEAYVSVSQWSSLLPLGASVLGADGEYVKFAEMFSRVAKAFEQNYPGKTNYTLDFEYKKMAPGRLEVKQVREIPLPGAEAVPTYLLNEPGEWVVFQGEYGSVIGNHRLKSEYALETRDTRLGGEGLAQTLFRQAEVKYLDDGLVKTLSGSPATFSNARHQVLAPDGFGLPVVDSWSAGAGGETRTMSLKAVVRTNAAAEQTPILTLAGIALELEAAYGTAQPSIQNGEPEKVTNEYARLEPRPRAGTPSIPARRVVTLPNGVAAEIDFFWPVQKPGISAGYTAPLLAWKETRITGLTAQPIVLKGYYSQTYRPGHHNFWEEFIFEPALEPGMASEILQELESKKIRRIYVYWDGGFSGSKIYAGDTGWNFRLLGEQAAP